jgi:hypothetical protein
MEYLNFAKNHCCNYGNGPSKKSHFCWLEPGGNNYCLLYENNDAYCAWFVSAVLPLNKDLRRQYQDQQRRIK